MRKVPCSFVFQGVSEVSDGGVGVGVGAGVVLVLVCLFDCYNFLSKASSLSKT